MDQQLNSVGWRLEELRSRLGLKQKELGDKLGVSQAAISDMVQRNSVSRKMLIKLTETFPGLSVDWLLTGTGKPFAEDAQAELPMTFLRSGNSINPIPFDKHDPRYLSYIEAELEQKKKELEEVKEENKELWDTLKYIKKQSALPGKLTIIELSQVEEVELLN